MDLLLVVEVDLPWNREIWTSPAFPSGLFSLYMAALKRASRKVGVVCIAPDAEYSKPGLRRVMVLRRPAGMTASYEREEYAVPDEHLLPLVQAVLEEGALHAFGPYRQEVDGVRDPMVCTHGTVDSACGRFGFPVYAELRRARAPGLRVWRVSHFGGHRFAATALELPEMRYWGHLEAESLSRLVSRWGEPAALRRHNRGWAALATPFEQALEREAFEREGWDWLAWEKASQVLEQTDACARVSLAFRSPDGLHAGVYEARVEVSHRLSVVVATGKEPEEVAQYRVCELVRREWEGAAV